MSQFLPSKLIIATRGSALAVWQAEYIKSLISKKHSGIAVGFLIVKTKGDKITNLPLAKIGGKGLFVKEIEEAVLDGRADIAVHSMKDLPMDLAPGLTIGAMPIRGAAEDIYLSYKYPNLQALPKNSKLGSSSLRRQAQALITKPDIEPVSLRGNINTRIKKLERGEYDAIILAKAGLDRLELKTPCMQILAPEHFIPAAGQGALGIEFRYERKDLANALAFIDHAPTRQCVEAERSFLRTLNGSCHAPIAAWARFLNTDTQMTITGFVASEDGKKYIYHTIKQDEQNPAELGVLLAQMIREMATPKGIYIA